MLRGVNATALRWLLPACLLALLPGAACRKTREPRDAAGRVLPDAAPVRATLDAGGDAPAAPPANLEALIADSARFMPPPYERLRIGARLSEVMADFPAVREADSRGDPERLRWFEIEAESGLKVKFGFGGAPGDPDPRLRSVQFLSLLQTPTPAKAPDSPGSRLAWRGWVDELYQPLIRGLAQRYGEKAEVYSCGGGGEHPLVRIVWRGEALALTAAFLLHEKGLSSTLIVTFQESADRYLKSTQCRWVQDRVL